MDKHSSAIVFIFCALAGCTGSSPQLGTMGHHGWKKSAQTSAQTIRDGTSTAMTVNAYKHVLAERIAATNSIHMFVGQPQALLRSVIVVKYQIDAGGKLVGSEIMRSNRDRGSEATALSSLKAASPFPKPASQLLKEGKVEVIESWLFNADGRFQLRTTAQPQMDR